MNIKIKAGLITLAIIATVTLATVGIKLLLATWGADILGAAITCILITLLLYISVHGYLDAEKYNKGFKD